MKNKIIVVYISIMLLVMSSVTVSADWKNDICNLDCGLLSLILTVTGFVGIIMIAIGGGLIVLSGTPSERARGRGYIMNGIIGIFIIYAFVFLANALAPGCAPSPADISTWFDCR